MHDQRLLATLGDLFMAKLWNPCQKCVVAITCLHGGLRKPDIPNVWVWKLHLWLKSPTQRRLSRVLRSSKPSQTSTPLHVVVCVSPSRRRRVAGAVEPRALRPVPRRERDARLPRRQVQHLHVQQVHRGQQGVRVTRNKTAHERMKIAQDAGKGSATRACPSSTSRGNPGQLSRELTGAFLC